MSEVVEVRLAGAHGSPGRANQLDEIGEIAARLGVDLVVRRAEAAPGGGRRQTPRG